MDIQPPTTLVELFWRRVEASGDAPAIFLPIPIDEQRTQYISKTWNEIARDVLQLAAVLQNAGVQHGDRVAQIAENCYLWILVDLATHLLGAVHVAIHPGLSGGQIAFQILDTDSRLVIVGNDAITQRLNNEIQQLRDRRPANMQLFTHDKITPSSSCSAEINTPSVVSLWTDYSAKVSPDELATILYSSGTTGEPRGVMLSHGNLTSNALAVEAAADAQHHSRKLAWLPLTHVYARTADLYAWIVRGSQLYLAERPERVLANCAVAKPTTING
ncbi:MAG: AMP-binding protein, partial [Planctomycetota bacterium]|nr:AMP-binding protein [Planctomycetota bacterium]